MKEQAQHFGVKELDAFYISITLHSASILRDPFLRYCRTIDGRTLAELLGRPDISFQPLYQATEMQLITGWNELWGTPKTSEYALQAGSTFLFACSAVLRALGVSVSRTLFIYKENRCEKRS